ncbi:hypothetical protein RCL1_003913 [Eukaryota sp. TZLM3-RCL]
MSRKRLSLSSSSFRPSSSLSDVNINTPFSTPNISSAFDRLLDSHDYEGTPLSVLASNNGVCVFSQDEASPRTDLDNSQALNNTVHPLPNKIPLRAKAKPAPGLRRTRLNDSEAKRVYEQYLLEKKHYCNRIKSNAGRNGRKSFSRCLWCKEGKGH